MPNFKVCPDGVYIHTKSPLVDGWEKYEKASDLTWYADDELEKESPVADLQWIGAKIPMSVFSPVIGTIKKFPTMETGYMLYYSASKREWMIKCPKQFGSAGSVRFNDDGSDMPPTFFPIGTVHTHPNMQAFWSGTDKADQRGKYGVHIVFGLRNGVIETALMTLFSPHGEYDKKKEDLFEDDVDFKADCQENKEWVDTINLSKEPYFKIIQNGKEFGPGAKAFEPPKIIRGSASIKRFDMNDYMFADKQVQEKEARQYKLRPFAQFLVDTYDYDPEELEDYFYENNTDKEDIEMIYGQDLCDAKEKHITGDSLAFASKEVESFLSDTWTIWDHPDHIEVPEPIAELIMILRTVMPVNFVRQVHKSKKLTKDQIRILSVINLFIPKAIIRMMLSDMVEQLDNMMFNEESFPVGGRFFSNELQLYSEMMLNSVTPPADYRASVNELHGALCRNSTSKNLAGVGCLSWKAMAVLLAYLFPFPEDIALYWEILRRMEKEGLVWC